MKKLLLLNMWLPLPITTVKSSLQSIITRQFVNVRYQRLNLIKRINMKLFTEKAKENNVTTIGK